MSKVYFSSVWEDYSSLREGLRPSENDIILSVSSSGDNIFNFISDKVKKVIAVDLNPAQLSLAKLKLEIIRQNNSQKVLDLLTGTGDRNENRAVIEKVLSTHRELKEILGGYNFSKGIDSIGEFETKVLPIITFFAKKFFKPDNFQFGKNQDKKPNIWLKILPVLFSFKSTYKFLLPDFHYQYININIGKSLKTSLDNFLISNDLPNNWYLRKIYFGRYELLPPFLRPDNILYLQKNSDKIVFVEKDVLSYLKELKDSSIDKINLSDIFDWCSQEDYSQILQEIYRVLSPNGIIFYWELFVSRELPQAMDGKFQILSDEADRIHKKDNLPFYHKIVLLKKKEFAAGVKIQ